MPTTKRPRSLALAAILLLSLSLFPGAVIAQDSVDPTAFNLDVELVADGLNAPVWMADPNDGSGRMFVVQQTGQIVILEDGVLSQSPFLDISGQISTGSEQGLLSMAFHPEFADNGQFFIFYTSDRGTHEIERWSVSAGAEVADPATAETILSIPDFAPNHNGGLLLFGPDDYLYIGLGDGGGGGDPEANGQNPGTLLGAILRIDVDDAQGDLPYGIPEDNPFVDTEGASPEIWAWGLRNPWRFSFDRETGDLYIADVGQGVYEEVSLAPAGQGGLNFGWNPKEGPGCYAIDPCDDPGFVDPFFWYSHDEGGCSITGGYVYRGEAIANLAGVYLAADYCSGLVWAVDPATGNVAGPLESGMAISSFAEDAEGELYILDHNGAMYRITG